MVNRGIPRRNRGQRLSRYNTNDDSAARDSVHDPLFLSGYSCVRLRRSDGGNSVFGSPAHASRGLGDVLDFRQSHPAGNFGIVWEVAGIETSGTTASKSGRRNPSIVTMPTVLR